jgi:hypothetical protein
VARKKNKSRKFSKTVLLEKRGGRNVEFHYYDRPFFSLHRKCLFSSSLHRNWQRSLRRKCLFS